MGCWKVSLEDDKARYRRSLHAMQAGVAAKMPFLPKETEPKHLRVGVNSAMVASDSLARLLISKGIITEAEYVKALADGMEQERKMYEKEVSELTGSNIKLY